MGLLGITLVLTAIIIAVLALIISKLIDIIMPRVTRFINKKFKKNKINK